MEKIKECNYCSNKNKYCGVCKNESMFALNSKTLTAIIIELIKKINKIEEELERHDHPYKSPTTYV